MLQIFKTIAKYFKIKKVCVNSGVFGFPYRVSVALFVAAKGYFGKAIDCVPDDKDFNRILMHLASQIRNSPYMRLQSGRYGHPSRARRTIELHRSAVLSRNLMQPRSAIRHSSSTQN